MAVTFEIRNSLIWYMVFLLLFDQTPSASIVVTDTCLVKRSELYCLHVVKLLYPVTLYVLSTAHPPEWVRPRGATPARRIHHRAAQERFGFRQGIDEHTSITVFLAGVVTVEILWALNCREVHWGMFGRRPNINRPVDSTSRRVMIIDIKKGHSEVTSVPTDIHNMNVVNVDRQRSNYLLIIKQRCNVRM